MQSRIIQSLFDIANENKIHLEKTQTDTEHNTLDYIVYFRKDFPVPVFMQAWRLLREAAPFLWPRNKVPLQVQFYVRGDTSYI